MLQRNNEIPSQGRLAIVNLSNYHLSEVEERVLSKGLTFVPTSRHFPFQFHVDFEKFIRSLQLRMFFKDFKSAFSDCVAKSTWIPPGPLNPALLIFKQLVLQDVEQLEVSQYRGRSNMSKEEFLAIQKLKNETSIVIRKADKGGAILVLNRTYYLDEIHQQLSDVNTYCKLREDPTFDVLIKIQELTNSAVQSGFLTKKECQFLCHLHPVTPILYTFPKIHKKLEAPSGRPIVSSRNLLLERICKYTDFSLRPLVQCIPAYIKDTSHFLQRMAGLCIEEKTLLVTLDVHSLYTSIPQAEVLEAVEGALETRP
ncbi:uncharacterized protein LOC115465513 [Microcaecilia unicolor]|uniref:Uncharacterized protein LOC115465513 n=1 Tax=Microcaecilia unicolor TaxID=1415580 RepID=A0A6P7XNB6_9AMPH|nr:uncharacterized protein LOC115465513 [Microcaecilia unicolor]